MIIQKKLEHFRGDERGTMLIFWGMSFVVILGIVALSFDMGRVAVTQTELQSYADNVALAAAGELDGQADALDRATAAAANLISDRKTFGSGDAGLAGASDYTLTFLSDLPSDDTVATSAVTTDPRDAAYVQVAVNSTAVEMTFAAAFSALTGNTGPRNTVAATAVAGYTQYACDVTHLMFCLPNPSYTADDNIGNMVRLRAGGSGASWAPGTFGFIDPPNIRVNPTGPCAGLSGINLDACLLAAEGELTECYAQRGVDIEPGQKVGIEDAVFNLRFDIYKSTMKQKKNDPDYPPAPNVVKGIIPTGGAAVIPKGGGICIGRTERPSPNSAGLPRDDCFESGTCDRFGDGDWALGRTEYVTLNYDGTDPHPSAQTRYEYYLAEIAAAGGAGSSTKILDGRLETGRPMCSGNQSTDPERRIVIAAGIDCAAHTISGAERNVPVKEYYKIFLTEPVGDDGATPPSLDIWGEIVGTAGGNGSAGNADTFRDVVQLHR